TLSVSLDVRDCAGLLVALDDPHQRAGRPELARPIAEVEEDLVPVGGHDRLGLELAGRDVVRLTLVFGAPADRRMTARNDLLALGGAHDLFRLLPLASPPGTPLPVPMEASLAELVPDRVRVAHQVITPAVLLDRECHRHLRLRGGVHPALLARYNSKALAITQGFCAYRAMTTTYTNRAEHDGSGKGRNGIAK